MYNMKYSKTLLMHVQSFTKNSCLCSEQEWRRHLVTRLLVLDLVLLVMFSDKSDTLIIITHPVSGL